VAALLTILGYSMYDTIIVFDRVRENIPRMPRAAFSQIVNRSMSEVLTRSLATTFCTLLPVVALLLFGGNQTLQDFAFALLIGVASGAYSSIFIASPVLMHWKEREHSFINRRRRIEKQFGYVPAYADSGHDVDPTPKVGRRVGRLTEPAPDTVSNAEFEQMKRDLELEEAGGRATSTLTKPVRAPSTDAATGRAARAARAKPKPKPSAQAPQTRDPAADPGTAAPPSKPASGKPANGEPVRGEPGPPASGPPVPAPDVAENDGMANVPKPKPPPRKSGARNRRHGRRR
jgi:SecD/SecF fusion protein